jgi:hypothetical protein
VVGVQSVQLPKGRQTSRHAKRAALAATIIHDGDMTTRRKRFELLHDELSDAPLPVAIEGWCGLARVLRLLDVSWLRCVDHGPHSAPFFIGCRGTRLLGEAERFAAFQPPSRLGGVLRTATEA